MAPRAHRRTATRRPSRSLPARSLPARSLPALALAAALLAAPRPAQAGGADAAAVVLVLAAGVTDIGFTSYDLVVAGKRAAPGHGAAIAEAIVGTPQALLVTGVTAALINDPIREHPAASLLVLPSMWVNAVAVHGIWAAATDRIRPELLPPVSLLVGTNVALSTFAVTRAVQGEWLSRPMALSALVLTAPQLAVGIPAALKSTTDRNAWLGAVGWSGALFLHALVSAIAYRPEPDMPPPPPPPPPPPEKPPLMVPASLQLGPTLLPGARGGTVPGLAVTGILF